MLAPGTSVSCYDSRTRARNRCTFCVPATHRLINVRGTKFLYIPGKSTSSLCFVRYKIPVPEFAVGYVTYFVQHFHARTANAQTQYTDHNVEKLRPTAYVGAFQWP